jgi:phosphatidylserine/phosphatidylglycerophosphate/cardiolipin synthase-like enzyme
MAEPMPVEATTSTSSPRSAAKPNHRSHRHHEIEVPCCLACELCLCCFYSHHRHGDDDDSVHDKDAVGLSHVGEAAYDTLRRNYNRHHHSLWNVTSGRVVGTLHQTPVEAFGNSAATGTQVDDLDDGPHNQWFPQKIGEIVGRTEVWCDLMSLGPPDGVFLQNLKEGLLTIAERGNSDNGGKHKFITIRMMFGNIVGMPVNCNALIKELTKDLPENSNIHLWVGAWRKGVSWNHAKLIAVDGKYLHTGGHNLWEPHYLQKNPICDLSLELQGRVAHDGHLYANAQWAFIERVQSTCFGRIIDALPDYLPIVSKTRVTVSEYPDDKAATFPPVYYKKLMPKQPGDGRFLEDDLPMITMGRYGTLLWRDRPSDAAIVAMLDSANHVIHMVLQDLGPVCIPGTKVTLPGCVWPEEYLSALGRGIWLNQVDVEIVLSNPGSIPGGLKGTEANYGNGWSCVDVAAEIIKTIKSQFPEAKDSDLRQRVSAHLRVCFLRDESGSTWRDGKNRGLHSKHFIVDDVCCYIGSQNLYICDLAEWGVVIDHKVQVQKFMEEYWIPMWKYSYTDEDCDVDDVMDGLKIDRKAKESSIFTTPTERAKQKMLMARLQTPTSDMGRNEENRNYLHDVEVDQERE